MVGKSLGGITFLFFLLMQVYTPWGKFLLLQLVGIDGMQCFVENKKLLL
jgi:hypothetical protein